MNVEHYTVNGKSFRVTYQHGEEFQCAEVELGDRFFGTVPFGLDFDQRLEDFLYRCSK